MPSLWALWAELEAALATARPAPGAAASQRAWDAGQALPPREAVADALADARAAV